MDASFPMLVLRMLARLRARGATDSIAIASVPVAALLIGAVVLLS